MSRTKETIMDNEKLQWAVVIGSSIVVLVACGVIIYKTLPLL